MSEELEAFFTSEKELRSQEILKTLRKGERKTKTYYHNETCTFDTDAKLDYIAGDLVESKLLQDENNALFLFSCSRDTKYNLQVLATKIGAAGNVEPATDDVLNRLLGVTLADKPEGFSLLTPLNCILDKKNEITVVLDSVMMRQPAIKMHPLNDLCTSSLSPADLVAFLEATGHTVKQHDFAASLRPQPRA